MNLSYFAIRNKLDLKANRWIGIFVDALTKINGMRWISLCIMLLMYSCGEPPASTAKSANQSPKQDSLSNSEKTAVPRIVFLGNSLTAGYGLSLEAAYPNLIQQKIDSMKWPYEVVNAGISGETTAGGRARIGWVLEQTENVHMVVVALGGNDGLRAIDPEATYQNLQAILDTIKAYDPSIIRVVAGMEAPPNLGENYTAAFRAVYPRLAKNNDITLMPFILKDVAGIPALNQADGIHPTAEGQRIIANNLWAIIAPLLQRKYDL